MDRSNEEFNYTYYGFEGKTGNRGRKKYVKGALKNDEYTPYPLRIFWVRRVAYRMHVNIGDGEFKKALTEFEKICLGILEKLLNCSSVSEMENKSDIYLSEIRHILQLWEIK